MPGIFTPARRNVRSDGTIVLGFWGVVKGFLEQDFQDGRGFSGLLARDRLLCGDHFSLSEAGFAGFWGIFWIPEIG